MVEHRRVYRFGSGESRIDPVHGTDPAEVCVDSVYENAEVVDGGGPEIPSRREIA